MLLIFSLVVLGACWWVGDQTFRTKVIFTVLFLASFTLPYLPALSVLFIPAQCALIVLIGGSTFGAEWLRRRR